MRHFKLIYFGAVVFLSTASSKSSNIDETLAKFIIDVAQKLYAPLSIVNLLCLDTNALLNFSKILSKSYVLHQTPKSYENFHEFIFTDKRHQQLFLLDLWCPYTQDLLQMANDTGMFIGPAKWLIIDNKQGSGNDNVTDSIEDLIISYQTDETFGNLNIWPDSEVIIGKGIENLDVIKILSIYRPTSQKELITEDRGNWTIEHGIRLNNNEITSRRRKNLQGSVLKSSLVMTNPDTINHLTDYHDKHVDTITKANYPWVLHLAKIINVTINFTITDTWGYPSPNGSWSGMIGMLQRHEVDIGGTGCYMTSNRIGVIDFVSLHTRTNSRFVFREPPLSSVKNIFALPFRPSVWIAIGVFLLIVFTLLYFTAKWEWHCMHLDRFKENLAWNNSNVEPTLSENLLVILGAVSQQGFWYEPFVMSTRITVLMLLLAAMSLYASYTANIVVLLQSTTDSIKTLQDLLDSSLTLGATDIVYNHYYFKSFQDPVRKAIYEKKVQRKRKKPNWMSLEEGIERMRKGLFAFHFETGAGYKVVQETYQESEKCGLREMDYFHVPDPLLTIQYRSPFLEIIRVNALKIKENGLQTREMTYIYTKKPACYGSTHSVSVGLRECYAAFVIMGHGFGIALTLLFFEMLWHRWKKRTNVHRSMN